MVRQLDEFRQRIRLEAQRESVSGGTPVCNCRCYAQEYFKTTLDLLCGISEVVATSRTSTSEEIFDESDPHVVTHPLKLLIHVFYVLVILEKLRYQRAVSQREKLRILQ